MLCSLFSMKHICWLSLFITIFCLTECSKILIYTPNISPSHVVMSGRMADVLVKAGHDVVLFIPEYDRSVTLNGTKLAKVWRMQNISDAFERGMEEVGPTLFTHPYGTPADRIIFEESVGEMCEAIVARHKELDVIRNYNFDMVITEMIDLCGLGITNFLGIKNHIWHSTTPLHDNVAYNLGVPSPISYVPSTEENLLGTKMTFRERFFNFYMYLIAVYLHHYGTDKATAAIQKVAGPNFPNVRKIASESTLAFVNSDEFLDIPRPILHKTIYIGGLGIDYETSNKALEEPFYSFISKNKKGVIVFSLGTIAPTSLIDEKTKQNLINIFSEFKEYNFIVKVDKDEEILTKLAEEQTTNVMTTSWMPQSDILGDARIKLFIMHGGFNGLLEAAIHGVPVIVIPLYADQYRNAKAAQYRGFGVIVEKMHMGDSHLKDAIHTILTISNYTQNAKRISSLIRTKPFKPNEIFVKWINFVSINGILPELTPEGAKMGIIEYFCLDVIVIAFSIPIFIMFSIVYIIRLVYYSVIHTKLKSE